MGDLVGQKPLSGARGLSQVAFHRPRVGQVPDFARLGIENTAETLVGSDQRLVGSDQSLEVRRRAPAFPFLFQTLVGSDQVLVGSDQLSFDDATLGGATA